MFINVEGKKLWVNVFGNETPDQALDNVYATMGLTQRPSYEDESVMVSTDMTKGITKDINLLELMRWLQHRFEITTNAWAKFGESEKLFANIAKFTSIPEMATKFVKKAVAMTDEEFNDFIRSHEFEKLDDFNGYVKITVDGLTILDTDKKAIGSVNKDTDIFHPARPLTEEEEQDLIASGLKISKVTVIDPPAKETKKPLQKSIQTTATVIEETADKVKEYIVESDGREAVVTTINNPTETITLAHTEQVAIKINMDKIKPFVNLDSIKNIPEDSRESVLLRVENAINTLSKTKDWNRFLSTKDKYGFSKAMFYSKDSFSIIRSRMMIEFKEDGNFYPEATGKK